MEKRKHLNVDVRSARPNSGLVQRMGVTLPALRLLYAWTLNPEHFISVYVLSLGARNLVV